MPTTLQLLKIGTYMYLVSQQTSISVAICAQNIEGQVVHLGFVMFFGKCNLITYILTVALRPKLWDQTRYTNKYFIKNAQELSFFLPFSVGNLMPCINSALNFLIYMLRGKKFRDAFKSTYEPELKYLRNFWNSCKSSVSCIDFTCNEFQAVDQSSNV